MKKKKKKKHLELSSFYKFTKNHMLCSQDMVYGRCNCFILGYFLPFYPTNSQKKIKLFKNKKSTWRYHHFTQVYQKPWLNAILFLRWSTWGMLLLYFILGYFLPFHPTTEISFCTSAPKIMICYTVPEGDPPPTNWRIGLSQYH